MWRYASIVLSIQRSRDGRKWTSHDFLPHSVHALRLTAWLTERESVLMTCLDSQWQFAKDRVYTCTCRWESPWDPCTWGSSQEQRDDVYISTKASSLRVVVWPAKQGSYTANKLSQHQFTIPTTVRSYHALHYICMRGRPLLWQRCHLLASYVCTFVPSASVCTRRISIWTVWIVIVPSWVLTDVERTIVNNYGVSGIAIVWWRLKESPRACKCHATNNICVA